MKIFNNTKISLKILTLALSLSLLTACGGGDGEETAGNDGGEGGIIGTAKIIVKSDDVKAKEKGGNTFKAKIGKNGQYKFSKLKRGSYLLRSESKTGQLYSVAYVNKGMTVTSNVHPITDLIIRNWFKQHKLDIDAEFKGSKAIAKMPKVAEINDIETAIEGILAQALKQSGVKGSVDLLGNTFEVKAGDTFNNFLSNNQVIINNNQITLIFTGDKVQTISISSKDLETDFTADKENPTTPTQLRALPSGTHEIVVVWQPSTDDRGVAGYNIYRNGQLVATTPYPVYTDKNLSQGTNYDYMVEAIDGVDKKSGKANSDAVTTLTAPDEQAPPAIANLSATSSDDDIALRWDITQVNDIARFIVKRGIRGMAKSEIASITANTFIDFNLSDGNYCYTITAADAAGNKSSESAEQCALINAGGTTPPVNRTIKCTSYTTLQTTTIDKDTTLNAGCYKVNSNISVNNPAKLTINPGVLLEFNAGTLLTINKGASMNASGTLSLPIIFTGKEKTPGYWDGIKFYSSNSINNQLNYVTIEYGVKNIDSYSYSSAPARFSIKNSLIRKASDVGIYIDDSSIKMDAFANNVLTENERPITIPAGLVGRLDANSSFNGNVDDVIHVWNQAVGSKQTWKNLNVPYFFRNNGTYYIKAGLNIDAGTKLIFSSGAGIEVSSNGFLKATGSKGNKILFTGFEKTPGYWKGLKFYSSNSTNNQLNYVTVEYGVKNIDSYSYSSAPSRFSITNSLIRQASDVGIFIDDPSIKMGSFMRNRLTENARSISIPSELVGKLGADSSYSGNSDDVIQVWNSAVVTNQVWKNLDVPYFLYKSSTYYIKAGVTIEAGSNLIFNTGAGIEVSSTGYLKAVGTTSKKIIFTGVEPLQGYWKGIKFYSSNSINNQFDYTVVEYGGNGATNAIGSYCYSSAPARFTIKNSTIKDSLGWGVFKDDTPANGCFITLDSTNSYSGNEKGNIRNP